METPSAHAALKHFIGQAESIGHLLLRAMKCRIKARDLRQVGPQLHHPLDGRQVVRLVQRHKGNELFQSCHNVGIDQRRPGELQPAMSHPVPNGDGSQSAAVLLKGPLGQMRERLRMPKTLGGARQGDFGQHLSALIFRFEPRGRAQTFNLSARHKVQLRDRPRRKWRTSGSKSRR